jgi:hypothetical protein
VVYQNTFSSPDPAKLVQVRWADGGSENVAGGPDRWHAGQAPASLRPVCPSKEEVARGPILIRFLFDLIRIYSI